MSTAVDQRVVEMRFDNRQFETNVSTTMSTLGKLKQSLNLTGATKGLENVGTAARGINLSGLGSAADAVAVRFSYMQASIQHQLNRIVDGAVDTGKKIVSALTIDPIKTGFQEYETQINAVQTILANTSHKGTTIDDVNGALDQLNAYADKTIYNFTEMTRNIGTFTAAGVDLDKSVTSIKGIANLAAVSGSTSQQASSAMYQLSQALAAGKVQLMDWNSVVNAGMGGEVFQNALKRTATHMGTNVDAMIKKYGSFRESLTKGEWLTAEVLTETLTQLSGAYTEADLIAQGYTEKQAKEIVELAKTAESAATDVKTFTQLWDTLKEAAQSGWTQTWELIVGDFEEAKTLLSGISKVLNDMIGKSAEARNKLIQGWKDAGGRDDLLEGFKNAFEGITNVVKPIKEAFRDIFPPLTVKNLTSFTEAFKNLTARFKEFGSKYSEQIKRTFTGVFSILDIGKKIVTAFAKSIMELTGSNGIASVGDFIMNAVASIGDFFTSLNKDFDVSGVSDIFSKMASGISSALGKTVDVLKNFGSILSSIGEFITDVASKIWDGLKVAFSWFSENFSAGDIFAGLAGGGIFVLAKKLIGFVDGIKEAFEGLFGKGSDGGGLKEKFADLLDGVHETLESFSTGIKVGSFVAIAAAIAILSSAFEKISKLDAVGISKSLITIGVSLGIMMKALNSMPTATKLTSGLSSFTESTTLIKSGIALMFMAKSLDILSDAILKLSDLSWKELAKGLVGVGGGIGALCGGLKILNGTKVSIGTSIAMLALAEACKILGDAMQKFVGFSWDEIARGLIGMGGALGEMVAALSILSKAGGFGTVLGGTGILIAVQSLSDLADGLEDFAYMSWKEIGRGLSGMGGALGEMVAALSILSKVGGFGAILGGTGILIVVQSLSDLAEGLKSFGEMNWDEIGRGIVAMGGALGEVAGITGVLGKVAGFSSIFASGAILIVVQGLSDLAIAFNDFGEMSWDEISRGLVGMGGALGEVALITGSLGKLAGFSSIFASGSLLIVIQGLGDLADAFNDFGGMSWDEIGRGLVGMGGALGEVAIITGTLGSLAGLPSLLGSGSLLIAIQGLGDLADALKKFGEMSWDEIGRGLTAMGAALGEVALGGLLNTLSGLGAMAISEMAAPLGTLADSVKKWENVTVPENLSKNLSSLASGVKAFTFGGLGAGALAEAAPAVGTMADSIRKWAGVTVPDTLGDNLSTLASGVKAFTFGGLGAGALSEAAPGVGAMANAVKKWSGVVVPEGLGTNLETLGRGVKAFTFGGSGASSLTEAAPGVGTMADSVKKWTGVTVPEELGENLKTLASGVKSFTFGGSGAGSLSEAAPGIGIMADSVKKWTGVTIPEDLVDNLGTLASGVKKFTFGGSGAESITTSASGLGIMADSVKKWTGVVVPEDLGTNLSTLASGVKAFTFGGMGADTLTTAASGVGAMADSVKKWSGVTIPEGFSDGLRGLANSIKSISGVDDISGTATELSTLAGSISKMTGTDYNTISTGLTSLSSAISRLGTVGSSVTGLGTTIYNEIVKPIKSISSSMPSVGSGIMSALASGINSGKALVISSISSVTTSLTASFSGIKGSLLAVGSSIMSSLASGIMSGMPTVMAMTTSLMSMLVNTIRVQSITFQATGIEVMTRFIAGLESGRARALNAMASIARAAATRTRSYYSSFYNAGGYLVQGFAAGITAYTFMAEARARAMANAAYQAAMAELEAASPSKLFIKVGSYVPMGFAIGIERGEGEVVSSATSMANAAFTATNSILSKLGDVLSSDIDAQPTIRPVMDLSQVQNGVTQIDGMLASRTVGLAATSSVTFDSRTNHMNEALNNISKMNETSNREVVNAISELRGDFGSLVNAINGMHIRMDSGTVVGELVGKIDRSLGQIAMHKGRGS